MSRSFPARVIREPSPWEKVQQRESTLSLLPEVSLSELDPNEVSFNGSISTCEKGHSREHAGSLLEDMWRREL